MPVEADPGVISLPGRILVVDDKQENVALMVRLLALDGHVVEGASTGEEALRQIHSNPPDLVLLDVLMPGMDGFCTCRELKGGPSTRLIPVVLITGLQDSADRIQGIEAGADDFLTKPFDPPELRARVRSLLRSKRLTDDLDSAASVMVSLALMIEARDAYTNGHCQRVATYATALGRRLELDADDLGALERAGFIHDIGKIGVPDAVLLKPGRLTPEEFDIVTQHTVIGDELCSGLRSLARVRPIVRHHHERWDGSGYPDALVGDAIPLLAQIISIADAFDAATTERPYKAAVSFEEAARQLVQEVALGWRRAGLVDTFTRLVGANHFLPVQPARRVSQR
jgi:putative two-component system response regulator